MKEEDEILFEDFKNITLRQRQKREFENIKEEQIRNSKPKFSIENRQEETKVRIKLEKSEKEAGVKTYYKEIFSFLIQTEVS